MHFTLTHSLQMEVRCHHLPVFVPGIEYRYLGDANCSRSREGFGTRKEKERKLILGISVIYSVHPPGDWEQVLTTTRSMNYLLAWAASKQIAKEMGKLLANSFKHASSQTSQSSQIRIYDHIYITTAQPNNHTARTNVNTNTKKTSVHSHSI